MFLSDMFILSALLVLYVNIAKIIGGLIRTPYIRKIIIKKKIMGGLIRTPCIRVIHAYTTVTTKGVSAHVRYIRYTLGTHS